MPHDAVTLDCPAKVNLALSVAARDPATGLHPLSSWMVAVDLCDTLTVRRLAPDAPSTFAVRFAPDAPRAEPIGWPAERDLSFRAHAAAQAAAGRRLPVAVDLVKRIPTGGGLGGGSSDAAGVLVALHRLFDAPVAADRQRAIAHRLGSDVPFALAALTGTPSAVVSGTGETVDAAPTPGGHLVLVMPPLGCGTAEVFAAFDQRPPAQAPADRAALMDLARRGAGPDCFNDLARPAMASHPPLADVFDRLTEHAGRRVHVTGSGSTCFVIARDRDDAQALARGLAGLAGCATHAACYPFFGGAT